MLVCGTGYTGEDGVELLLAPTTRRRVWDAILAAGATPAGLGARDTLRLEVCFPLYGNDLGEERGPIEAGLGWCCREATGFIGAEAVARARRERAAERSSSPFAIDGAGIARQGNAVVGGGEVTSGTLLAVPGARHRDGVRFRPSVPATGTRDRDRRARHDPRRPSIERKPLYRKGAVSSGRRQLSRRPALPPRARLGPDRGRRGDASGSPGTRRTRSARSCTSTRRKVGARGHAGRALRRGRVGEGGLRRVRAALGRGRSRSTRRSSTSPRRSTRTPTGTAGW